MESNVSHTVPAAEQPHLLAQARPFDTLRSHLDGIGFLYDRGTYMEIRYDGCNHSGNFMRNRMTWAEAADWVRAEMATCGHCDFQARVDRLLANG